MRDPSLSRAEVLAVVARDPAPTRAQLRRRAALLGAAGVILALGIFAAVGGFRDGGLPREQPLISLTFGGTAALTTAWAALTLRPQVGWTQSLSQRRLLLAAAPTLLFAWKVGCSAQYAGATDWWPERPGLRCLAVSLLLGAPVLAALLAMQRRSAPRDAGLSAAGLGALAGLFAALLVDLWCPVGHPVHVLLGHVLPMLAWTAFGAAAGRRVIAI